MINELIELMIRQEQDLKKLLELFEIQHEMILNKDLFGLEGIADSFNECGKKIAKEELERRNIIGENNILEVVNGSNNDKLKEVYGSIRDTLRNVLTQKETNELLLKQHILFNTKMLNIMNPSRTAKTYTSYGNLSR
ncbi:flagellar protein FlgN [Clostridium beijerinckii]|uniref:flagellar protein FlgN n=1 Tax=Clostridium beijerinckii TaxID=1520 RepID=UPI00156DD690|nr:flagellar protein FlgN [Clostridium beijerinckii]NRT73728.1 flagellar biosynthesis/type III secretory pathway chaperone [Clostridium beijerinckii]